MVLTSLVWLLPSNFFPVFCYVIKHPCSHLLVKSARTSLRQIPRGGRKSLNCIRCCKIPFQSDYSKMYMHPAMYNSPCFVTTFPTVRVKLLIFAGLMGKNCYFMVIVICFFLITSERAHLLSVLVLRISFIVSCSLLSFAHIFSYITCPYRSAGIF